MLVLLYLVMLSVDPLIIPGRPAVVGMEMKEEWIWGRGKVREDWEE